MKKRVLFPAAACWTLVICVSVFGQTTTQVPDPPSPNSVTSGVAYTQNFDSLVNSGTATTNTMPPPVGWAIAETVPTGQTTTVANGDYRVGTGSSATGDSYSFGVAAGNTDRALGSLTAGTITPIRYGARFQNDSGTTITALTIQYTGEQWRGGSATGDRLDFAYSLDAISLSTGTWSDVDSLDFPTPNLVTDSTLDGNAVGNRTVLTLTISGLNIPNGSTFWVRWSDTDVTGTDDALSIDDFSLQIASTTAVKVSSFTSLFNERPGVTLEWQTGFEVNNLGFNVYRERRGTRVRINPAVIAGSALKAAPGIAMTAGNSYSWGDPSGTADSKYFLEDIDIEGTRTMHGPVVPSVSSGSHKKSERAISLDELNSRARAHPGARRVLKGWTLLAGDQSSASSVTTSRTGVPNSQPSIDVTQASSGSLDKQRSLAAMPALKLGVKEDGWYRVTHAALVAAGFTLNADMRFLQLYAGGVEVPLRMHSSRSSGPLRAGDSIEFYGVALDTPASDTREYWLVQGATWGKRVKPQVLKNANPSGFLPSFEYTVERKERLLYFSGLLNGDKENFFGQVINSAPVDQILSVERLRASDSVARLEVALQGVTLQDHVVRVDLNGRELGLLRFAGLSHKIAEFSVDPGFLHEGDNTVTLQRTNGDMDISLVDYLRLSYEHAYRADNDYLQFTLNGRAQVTGFRSPEVVLLDITDPNSVGLFNPKTEKTLEGYRFALQTSGTRTFLALTEQHVVAPSTITLNQPSKLSSDLEGAEFVVISHKDFRRHVEPLAQLRRDEGMTVAVVDVEDVYDEFSYGVHDPSAIREFLNWAKTRWQRPPEFVLLVGDGSFDPRKYLGQGTDFMPARLVDTALLETASDEWFVDFDNDGIGEIAIGRLPIRTEAEAEQMISKIVNYSSANTIQKAVLIADRTSGPSLFNFELATDELANLLPAITVEKIFHGDNPAAVVHDRIMSAINQGPLLVQFMGHGSVEVWTGGPVLSTADVPHLTNGDSLPLFLMMTCLNGYYHDPARESLAESLMRADSGGAVAVWASSGMTDPVSQLEMNRQFHKLLFEGPPMRLGKAIETAKAATSDLQVRRTWILFGDPTMRIR